MSRADWTDRSRALQGAAGPEHRAFMDQAKGQLLIVLLNRLGGSVDLPVTEVDDTGKFNLLLSVNDGEIHLETARKQ